MEPLHRHDPDAVQRQRLLLTRAQVAQWLSVSISTVDRLRQAHALPAPLSLGGRLLRWHHDDLERFVADRGDAQSGQTPSATGDGIPRGA